jgi:membrane protein
MKKKFSFKLAFKALKDAFHGFSDHKVTKLSASLAYYTVFSLGPLLIVIIFLCSIFFGQDAVQGTIYGQLKSFIGSDAAAQIQTMIKNASVSGKGAIAATIGVITLLIGASSVFAELQDSMNSIWGVKAKPKAGMMQMITSRLLSFGMIASLGFLLLVSLAATTIAEGLGARLKALLPEAAVVFGYIVNLVVTLGVVTVLFAIIFKVLPDIRLRWKAIWPGAIATGILFLLGKFAISIYISKSNVGSTYGSAGSLVILLLWIYYSAIIVYYGAEFTKALAVAGGADIQPSKYATWQDKPAIAGAKPASQTHNTPEAQKERKYKHGIPHLVPVNSSQLQVHAPEPVPDERARDERHPAEYSVDHHSGKKGGVGMMLLGIALYLVSKKKE